MITIMKPEYTEDGVYCLIASWDEDCGFEIKYSDRNDQSADAAHTRPDEYGPSAIQMYNAKTLYIPFVEYYGYFGCHDDFAATIVATHVLAHELSHQIFSNVSCVPFAKLFGIEPVWAAN